MPERMSEAAIVAVVMLLIWFRGNEGSYVVALDFGRRRSDGVCAVDCVVVVVLLIAAIELQHLTE